MYSARQAEHEHRISSVAKTAREIFSVPAGLDDATDVVEDGHGPLPVGEYAQRVRRFLHQAQPKQINDLFH